MAYIEVIHEVCVSRDGWSLCFQWGRYNYDDGTSDMGYRFIWKDQDVNMQLSRGQARIPSAADMFLLIHKATDEGWFVAVENKYSNFGGVKNLRYEDDLIDIAIKKQEKNQV